MSSIYKRQDGNSFSVLSIDGDSSEEDSSKVSRDILILGGGNFSKLHTQVERRMSGVGIDSKRADLSFPTRVIATELKSEKTCLQDFETAENIRKLKDLGVEFRFGIDGRFISKTFKGQTFRHIYFDCPDTGEAFCDQKDTLRNLITSVSESAYQIQSPNGQLHFSLIHPHSNGHVWQSMHYDITRVEATGYSLYKIKLSGQPRYTHTSLKNDLTKWTHAKTDGDRTITAFYKGVREFIFTRSETFDRFDSSPDLGSYTGYRKRTGKSRSEFTRIKSTANYYKRDASDPLSSDSENDLC